MAQAERAYRIPAYTEPAHVSTRRRNLRADRTGSPEQATTPLLVTFARMVAIILVVTMMVIPSVTGRRLSSQLFLLLMKVPLLTRI